MTSDSNPFICVLFVMSISNSPPLTPLWPSGNGLGAEGSPIQPYAIRLGTIPMKIFKISITCLRLNITHWVDKCAVCWAVEYSGWFAGAFRAFPSLRNQKHIERRGKHASVQLYVTIMYSWNDFGWISHSNEDELFLTNRKQLPSWGLY